MQSFCRATYLKLLDVILFWLNRRLLPDTIGTAGDSHTGFPLGISFPGGSSLVAFVTVETQNFRFGHFFR